MSNWPEHMRPKKPSHGANGAKKKKHVTSPTHSLGLSSPLVDTCCLLIFPTVSKSGLFSDLEPWFGPNIFQVRINWDSIPTQPVYSLLHFTTLISSTWTLIFSAVSSFSTFKSYNNVTLTIVSVPSI